MGILVSSFVVAAGMVLVAIGQVVFSSPIPSSARLLTLGAACVALAGFGASLMVDLLRSQGGKHDNL